MKKLIGRGAWLVCYVLGLVLRCAGRVLVGVGTWLSPRKNTPPQ